MAKENQKIEDCIRAFLDNLLNKDLSIFWPLPLTSVEPCFIDLFANETYRLIKEANEKSISNKKIAEAFKYPSRFASIIYYIIVGSKQAGWAVEKRLDLLSQIFEINSFTKIGNIFNIDRKNLILSSQEIESLARNTSWNFVDSFLESKEISKLVARLSGLLWIYCDCLYFISHKNGLERHGQYNINLKGEPYNLMIRNGYDLKPADLWPGQMLKIEDFPYESIDIFNVYKDTNIEFDVFDNPIHEENLVERTIAFYIRVSTKREIKDLKTTHEIQKACQSLEEYIQYLSKKINNWSISQKATKFIEAVWYMLKPLYGLLGKSWTEGMPQKVFTRIEEGYLRYPPPPPPENPEELFRNILDPRI